jgi:hypothetical protein
MDAPSQTSEPVAHLRLLARDQAVVKPAKSLEDIGPREEIATARSRVTDWCVPFDVAETVVDGHFRTTFLPPPADDGHFGIRFEEVAAKRKPLRLQFAITVDELNVTNLRIQADEFFEPFVARSSSREWTVQ